MPYRTSFWRENCCFAKPLYAVSSKLPVGIFPFLCKSLCAVRQSKSPTMVIPPFLRTENAAKRTA